MTRVAAIIIGDEILSGKVRDSNAPLLVERLRDLGVELWRLCYIGDSLQDISREVRFCADRCDLVITSGGIGPTHDDRTSQGVALAFGAPMIRHPELERLIRHHWQGRLNDAALAMADGPEGSRLLFCDDGLFPIVVYRNIYLLPGVPSLFAAKLTAITGELRGGRRLLLHSLYLRCDETSIAASLDQVEQAHDGIKIGSYPRLDTADHRLWITVESLDEQELARAVARLLELLPAEHLVRSVPPDDSGLFR